MSLANFNKNWSGDELNTGFQNVANKELNKDNTEL